MIAHNDDSDPDILHSEKIRGGNTQRTAENLYFRALPCESRTAGTGDALYIHAKCRKGEGIWAASGVNEANVAMTATETITTNPRVQGADPLVVYQPAKDGQEEVPGGIGEEDIVCLELPYIKSAREVLPDWDSFWKRMAHMKITESLSRMLTRSGGWRRSADITGWQEECRMMCMSMPNQLGIDTFDLEDALGEQKEYMCSRYERIYRKIPSGSLDGRCSESKRCLRKP